jgi:hypothetical protein
MYKNATKCNETIGKWCKNKHGASKIIDTFETYQPPRSKPGLCRRAPLLHADALPGRCDSMRASPWSKFCSNPTENGTKRSTIGLSVYCWWDIGEKELCHLCLYNNMNIGQRIFSLYNQELRWEAWTRRTSLVWGVIHIGTMNQMWASLNSMSYFSPNQMFGPSIPRLSQVPCLLLLWSIFFGLAT